MLPTILSVDEKLKVINYAEKHVKKLEALTQDEISPMKVVEQIINSLLHQKAMELLDVKDGEKRFYAYNETTFLEFLPYFKKATDREEFYLISSVKLMFSQLKKAAKKSKTNILRLEQAIEVLENAPEEKFNMQSYLQTKDDSDPDFAKITKTSCNTIACFAGWIWIAKASTKQKAATKSLADVELFAKDFLKLNNFESPKIFSSIRTYDSYDLKYITKEKVLEQLNKLLEDWKNHQ